MHDFIREVRDAVYGFTRLSKAEWEIVNSPQFQRLRDIKQLAMGHMVFPGATHTRLEHSVGCTHLADVLIRQLWENSRSELEDNFSINPGNFERARRMLRLAALLHDIGHSPFSHSGEEFLPMVSETSGQRRLSHEDMTSRVIRTTEVGQKINDLYRAYGIDAEDVIAVATNPAKADGKRATAYHLMLNEILTGDLGADRIDYLMRDGYHAGLRAGGFDHERLIGEIALVPKPPSEEKAPIQDDGGFQIGFREGGFAVAEQMIAARYVMYTGLYFHKIKRIYEIHSSEFLREWLKGSGGTWPADTARFTSLTDSSVLGALAEAAANEAAPGHDVAKRFFTRGHRRTAKELVLADNFKVVPTDPLRRRVPDKERFDKLSEDVRIKFGKQSVTIDSMDHSATKMFTSHNMLVVLDRETRYLDSVSEIVRGMSSRIWRGRIYCDREQKPAVNAYCTEWLRNHPLAPWKEPTHDQH
jgi:HD superfamily phosphohydrolase